MQVSPTAAYATAIKQYVHKAVVDKYTNDIDDVLSRVATSLVTQKDAENFLRLLNELYNAGYIRAMDAAKASLAEHGMTMELKPSKS